MKRTYFLVASAFVLQFVAFHTSFAASSTCSVINSVPAVINEPGVYCLKRGHSVNFSSGTAIDIQSPDVTFDMVGYKIENEYTASDSTAFGVTSGSNEGVTIRNGTLEGFNIGINMAGPTGLPLANIVEKMRIEQSISTGIRIGGISGLIRDNFIDFVGRDTLDGACGILVDLGGSSRIIDNRIFGVRGSTDATAICFDGGSGVVENNTTEEIRIDISPGVNGPAVKAANTGFTSSVIVVNNRFTGTSSWTAGSTAVVSVSDASSLAVCRDNVITFYASAFNGCIDGGGNTVVP